MKILYFPKNSYLFCDPGFYATVQKFRLLDYVTVACNSRHDIKGPGKSWFSKTFINSCCYSNGRRRSDIEGLAHRIN